MSDNVSKHRTKTQKKKARREKIKEKQLKAQRQNNVKTYIKYSIGVLFIIGTLFGLKSFYEPKAGDPVFGISPSTMGDRYLPPFRSQTPAQGH
jgi:hypothetical protein